MTILHDSRYCDAVDTLLAAYDRGIPTPPTEEYDHPWPHSALAVTSPLFSFFNYIEHYLSHLQPACFQNLALDRNALQVPETLNERRCIRLLRIIRSYKTTRLLVGRSSVAVSELNRNRRLSIGKAKWSTRFLRLNCRIRYGDMTIVSKVISLLLLSCPVTVRPYVVHGRSPVLGTEF